MSSSTGLSTAVSVLGVGAIGSRIAETLLAAGATVTVWNRSPGRTHPLVGRGAVEAGSAAQAASASSLVILCLTNYTAVNEVLDAISDTITGRTVVTLTTGSPDEARHAARKADLAGAAYLDGGVQTKPEAIGSEAANFLYSGPQPAFDEHRSTLQVIGSARYLAADPAAAAVQDLALFGLWYDALERLRQAHSQLDPLTSPSTRPCFNGSPSSDAIRASASAASIISRASSSNASNSAVATKDSPPSSRNKLRKRRDPRPEVFDGLRVQICGGSVKAVLGHRTPNMSIIYSTLSDPTVKRQYQDALDRHLGPDVTLAGPAADALREHRLDPEAVSWLQTNFLKTELELGHCLRTPAEGPCECDLVLTCSKFLTTSDYAPRLKARVAVEQQLIDDATVRGWQREIERHATTKRRIERLLKDLGQ